MPVNYTVAVRNNRLQQVENAIDGGGSNASFIFLDGGGNVLSTIPLNFPAGLVAGGVLTFQGGTVIDPSAARTGTATQAQVKDSAGNVVISGLVVGQDVFLSPTSNIVAGQVVALTAGTIQGN